MQPLLPVFDGFFGQAVPRSPGANIRKMPEHVAPCRAPPAEFLTPLKSLPQADEFPEGRLVRDREVEAPGNTLVLPRLAVLVWNEKVFVGRCVAFIFTEELQAWHGAHGTVKVRDFACNLKYERPFGDDRRRIVAKFAQYVRVAERAFKSFELRAEPSSLASRTSGGDFLSGRPTGWRRSPSRTRHRKERTFSHRTPRPPSRLDGSAELAYPKASVVPRLSFSVASPSLS